jgi:hypothetical protein
MATNTAMIDGVQIPGKRYIVFGKKRGYVSTHRTKRAAYRALVGDSRRCLAEGNPSDAIIYRWRDGWVPVGRDEVDVELVELPPGR